MGLLDSITGGISKALDLGGGGGIAGLLGGGVMDAIKSVFDDPSKLASLLTPGGQAAFAIDLGIKMLSGTPAQSKGVASFTPDPQTAIHESRQGMLHPSNLFGQADDSMKVFGGSVIQTPGNFSIAISGGDGKPNISIGQEGNKLNVKVGETNFQITGFDPTKATSFTLPDGTQCAITSQPSEGGRKCGCTLPDGTRFNWELTQQGGKESLSFASIVSKMASGATGGVLLGPFKGVFGGLDKAEFAQLKDGLVATPQNRASSFAGNLNAVFTSNRNTSSGGASSLSGLSEGDRAMLGAITDMEGQIEDIKKKFAGAPKEKHAELQFELQSLQQKLTQMQTMQTNLLASDHNAKQSVTGNLRIS